MYFALVCIFFFSCKKEKSPVQNVAPATPATPLVSANYYALDTGSYWVYYEYTVDTLNNSTYIKTDSVWIKGDTVIRGNIYYVMKGVSFSGQFTTPFRDSSGWLIDNSGLKYCNDMGDTSIFNTVIDTPQFTVSYAMQVSSSSVTVLAGTFNCNDALGTFKFLEAGYKYGNPRYLYNYYSSGIGIILQTDFFTFDSSHLERRLIRYYIK
jgi:hypothetical protein